MDPGFNRRLDVVRDVLKSYGLEATSTEPIEYEEARAAYYNNYIYKVTLASPATPASFGFGLSGASIPPRGSAPAPLTVPPPESGTSTLCFRLSNPRAPGINNTNRIQNELAAMHLARTALGSQNLAHLVPAVHAWRAGTTTTADPHTTDEAAFSWMVVDFRPGRNLDEQWASLSSADRLDAVGQIADAFAALQKAPLPPAVIEAKQHCGLTVDEATGEIKPGQMTVVDGGPFASLADVFAARIAMELRDADGSAALAGWRSHGIRERIDAFMRQGLAGVLEGAEVQTDQFALVHGDLTTNNLLYDPDSKRLTALLDFDFSSVTHPAVEFFSSFMDLGGATHRHTGPAGSLYTEEVAQAWDAALVQRGVLRPADIKGIDVLEKLRRFQDSLAPFMLTHDFMLRRMTPEKKDALIKEKETDLIAQLEAFGY